MYEIHYKPHLSKSKNEAIISMTKKEVQSQMSARMLSLNFKDVIPKEFGEAPRIIPCYMIQDNNSHHVYVLEEKLKGKFVKYMNNDGRVYKDLIETEHGKKISAFCHFVYHKYNRKLMVADLQGVGLSLTDISMATWEVGDLETQELYFGCDNMSQQALNNFCQEHTCNSYCRLLKLKDMEPLVDLIDEQLKGEGLDCESNII
ncbi:transient receptor potential cation channel subfamily M member 7-like, partial [Saccoglossus kowalevskii]|uniref:Transient receptor potential cation channel subfamily M member 7-like n=1 Tax=Saccoglossus kowalevskii TaxID=10224 RepID=A0ABM0ME07_SACKO